MQYYMILATGGKMIIKGSGVIHCYKHVIPSRFMAAKPYASSMPNEYIDQNKHKLSEPYLTRTKKPSFLFLPYG